MSSPVKPEELILRERISSLWPRLAISLLIAVGFFWVLRTGGLPMFPATRAFALLKWWAVPTYVASYCVISFLRTYRWIYLLRPIAPGLSPRRILGIGLVGFTAVVFAPLRMGEIARPWLIAQDGEVSFLQATGTVAAERIVDGLALTLMLITGLSLSTPISPLPDHVGKLPLPVAAVPAAAYGALALFSAAFVAMGLFYFWRREARRVVEVLVGFFSVRFAVWCTSKVEKVADGLSFLPSRQHAGAFVRDTIAYWLIAALGAWALLRGCGAQPSFSEACVTIGIMGIGSLIPSGPGFFGAYQLSAYCGLAMFFSESVVLSSGAVFTFVSYTTQIVITGLSCLVGWWLMSTAPAPSAPAVRASQHGAA